MTDRRCTEEDLGWAQDAAPRQGRLNPGFVSGLLGLFFLAYPISELFQDDPSALRVTWVLAVAAVFVASYLVVVLGRPGAGPPTLRRLGPVLAVFVVCDLVLGIADRPEWSSVITVYLIAFLAIGVGGRAGIAAIAVAAAAVFTLYMVKGYDVGGALSSVASMVVVGVALFGFGQLIRANIALREARAEITRLAVDDERRRFARDVHDLLGHSLSVITLKAQVARRLLATDPDRAAAELTEIEQVSRQALAEAREAVTGYRRPTIPGELAAARAALESAGVALDARVTRMTLDEEDEAVLAWALREGATNVVRHAGARHVRVRVEEAPDGVRLELADDGRGTDAGDAGNGLRGLTERVLARQGSVETGPAPGGGFRLAVTLPGEGRS